MDLLHNKKEIVMEQYIPKSVLVAEIERRKQKLLDHIICERDKEFACRTAHQLNRLKDSLDTLEVKEVKLTWKDMRQIVAISDRVLIQKGNLDDKGFYEAVLDQFNKAQKGE